MNTDLAKKWLEDNEYTGTTTVGMVTAFAKYLDEREVMENGCACRGRYTKLWATHSKTKCSESDEPRKEDKPCEHDYCVDRHECKRCGFLWPDQPKPEPIEEWVDPFDYDWSNDPERDFRRIAGVLVDIGNRLNAVCRRLNTLTK